MTLKTSLILVSTSLFALTACTAPDQPTTTENQRTKEGALIGGLVGAGVGAAIGYNLDQQAAELQQDFSDGRIQIINNGDHLIVRMQSQVCTSLSALGHENQVREGRAHGQRHKTTA